MNQQEILTKLSGFKGNLQQLLDKSVQKFKGADESGGEEYDDEGADNFADDLPLTLSKDPSPGVKFYSTENSELARNAAKEDAHGIDSFGEQDTFTTEEADDFQTNRDRNQNSDLSQRFYTNGMDLKGLNDLGLFLSFNNHE